MEWTTSWVHIATLAKERQELDFVSKMKKEAHVFGISIFSFQQAQMLFNVVVYSDYS
jgi:hypothetical protein